jgi:hypothetical protein
MCSSSSNVSVLEHADFASLSASSLLGLHTVTVHDGCMAVIVWVLIPYCWSQNIRVIWPSQCGLPVIFSHTMTGANGCRRCIRFVFNVTVFELYSL